MIKLITTVLFLSFTSPTFASEAIKLNRILVDVFEKRDFKITVHNKFGLNQHTIALHPEKPLLDGEEKRWVGRFSKEFIHEGKVFSLKIEVLKLIMDGENPTYHLTSLIGPSGENDGNLGGTTVGELDNISGKRRLRQDSSFFEYEGLNPFKIVAGFSY
jgi:hypothetical protein